VKVLEDRVLEERGFVVKVVGGAQVNDERDVFCENLPVCDCW